MSKAIQSMSAMLAMLALVCFSMVSFTACSDDGKMKEMTYYWGFDEVSSSSSDFMDDINKISSTFAVALGAPASASQVTMQGTSRECDKKVHEACLQALESLKDEVWQLHCLFTVINLTTGETIFSHTFDADDENLIVWNFTADDLKIGDYFYSDGSWSDGGLRELDSRGNKEIANPKPRPVEGKTIVGIVFQTDPNRIGQAEKDALAKKGVSKPHGLVMAVKNAARHVSWGVHNMEGLPICDTDAANYNDISGYGNCEHVRANHGHFYSHNAFKAADNYNTTCPVSATTTGWYLPSSGQLWDIMQNLGSCWTLWLKDFQTSSQSGDLTFWASKNTLNKLNSWMETFRSESDMFRNSFSIWSSSENLGVKARGWGVDSNGDVFCNNYYKSDYLNIVRPVLAF